ncbi:hypothetical protein [Streptomyces sp. CB03238]|uniref:hypothetical protein n=1 Tax=Streptomyces sp. CB03238 TaxID=1907777 RepID=UPI000A113B4A|nr:hypothetical protein [Streptomyces sp. CB03238]ORT54189.1 hypothetical protein BKD26_35950 [Streptomyces sp. CB03238]
MTSEVTITIAADGRGWVDGHEVRGTNGTLEDAHAATLAHVVRIARQRRRAVKVTATEPDGRRWAFVVTTDGDVLEPHQATHLTQDPDAEDVPAAYAVQVAAVCAALDSGREHAGMGLALKLEGEVVGRHGGDHPYVWRVRELRAHAAVVCGLPGTGCELYLEAARGWAELHSPAYWAAVRRAYALWHHATEQPARMVWLGEQLKEVLELGGPRATSARTHVVQRVDELRLGDIAS